MRFLPRFLYLFTAPFLRDIDIRPMSIDFVLQRHVFQVNVTISHVPRCDRLGKTLQFRMIHNPIYDIKEFYMSKKKNEWYPSQDMCCLFDMYLILNAPNELFCPKYDEKPIGRIKCSLENHTITSEDIFLHI